MKDYELYEMGNSTNPAINKEYEMKLNEVMLQSIRLDVVQNCVGASVGDTIRLLDMIEQFKVANKDLSEECAALRDGIIAAKKALGLGRNDDLLKALDGFVRDYKYYKQAYSDSMWVGAK